MQRRHQVWRPEIPAALLADCLQHPKPRQQGAAPNGEAAVAAAGTEGADDEADSAAVTRRPPAALAPGGAALKGISSESKRRLLDLLPVPVAGTSWEVCSGASSRSCAPLVCST